MWNCLICGFHKYHYDSECRLNLCDNCSIALDYPISFNSHNLGKKTFPVENIPEPLPECLIRESDKERFTLNDDNQTYSMEKSKSEWPDHLHNKWSYIRLMETGYFKHEED